MDHLAGRLAAASLSSDDPSAAAAVGRSGEGNLIDVIRAVERAEGTIRDQLEENNRLKDELMRKTRQLQMISEDATSQGSFGGVSQEPRASVANKMDGSNFSDRASSTNPQGASILRQNGMSGSGGEPQMHDRTNQNYPDSGQANGAFRRSSGELAAADSGGPSQFSTPSSRSLSPTRHRKGEYDTRINLAGQGLLPVSEMNSNISWKQDLAVKVKEREEEIALLREHLGNYAVKEAKILNEKCTLEKRIAYMRAAFDQQQQDLIDAASKALSYRQDIVEENVRLTYALQAAHQERSTFISSLVPLLSEYENLRPPVLDAQSIVSNLKVLFRHLQEQLMISEEKVQESQYQITPWQTELPNKSSLPVQSPNDPLGKALSKNSLDIVPQTPYPHVQSPMSSPVQGRGDWRVLANKNRHVIPSEVSARNIDHDYRERTSLSSSNQFRNDVSAEASQYDSHPVQFDFDTQSQKAQNPPFKGLSRSDVLDGSVGAEPQHVRETSDQWGPGDSPNLASGLEEATPSYPYLPTVPEEPGSSFSEAAEDDPLPGIKDLRITGEAFPGRELQASGFSIDGTTTCNFEWVRHLEDGSVRFIEGARQPNYLVTADDVDTLLVIEVQPLDERKRKGEVVKVYANDQAKITCDPETKELIKKTLEAGHVSYQVLLPVRFLDMWEPAVLAIKREGYSIKCNGQRGVVLTEKFQQASAINIPWGDERATEFVIVSADGNEYNLQPAENAPPRDTIVLVLRLFRSMAVEKRRGRKKGLFFK
ncbi:hypothetical protein QYE76_049602 [Lolium multiflorum]|uniref:Uncharacterized protein n=1 Tax=Lolium multiflorum TaxID=4521 RepID=A0AAD8SQE7_LOLMU|nr:hypothetical protein QYE76_049602 [Lolium multiflorum]